MRRTWTIGCTAVLVVGCGCPCDPDAEARDLAGDGAVHCGVVALGADPQAQLDCADAEIAGGRSFLVGFVRMGIDSQPRNYVVGDADGEHWLLSYDSDPSGGDGACARLVGSRCTEAPARSVQSDGVFLLCPTATYAEIRLCGD